ncbi:hypothetical protein [Olivibacter domesticus]|uniref:Lipocalin-like domain-containing protein n=1 Tax=Olivibacter domesticus TaxID=407022 RepID=A0A1H7QSU0_OLID1|nr:hypothetical protein [Olivibacter domesticus]SEL50778.1 hypothetical protein SAMN05661044_02704 [Olivibacter domesticus]
MRSVVFWRFSIFFALFFLGFACKKKENLSQQEIVGVWRSVLITTDIYEQDKLTESFELTSDEKNFNIMEFHKDGTFKSSGQFALDSSPDSTIKLADQFGKYKIKGNEIATHINDTTANLKMTFNFTDKNNLTVISEQMHLPNLNGWDTNHTFITITTFKRTSP